MVWRRLPARLGVLSGAGRPILGWGHSRRRMERRPGGAAPPPRRGPARAASSTSSDRRTDHHPPPADRVLGQAEDAPRPGVPLSKAGAALGPHVAPVNSFVERIRAERGQYVPYVNPDSGGVLARVLFVLESPARPASHGSGILSADNDDGTTANIWAAYRESGLPGTRGLHCPRKNAWGGRKQVRAVFREAYDLTRGSMSHEQT